MKRNLISIIVPVYNVELYIRRCIDSILAQTYSNWELILVNDGSPDNCPQICDEYSKIDSRIKVLHKENGGHSSARNAGLDIIQGDYITFIDSDDFVHELYLQELLDVMKDTDSQIVICKNIRGTDNSFENCNFNNKKKVILFPKNKYFYSSHYNVILCAKLYKRDLWDDVRMPLGKYYEDDWTSWRIYWQANHIAVLNKPLYYYYQNPSSIMAQHKKNVDISFVDAYMERISYFINKNDKLMIVASQWRLCLALMLTFCNPNLTLDQSVITKSIFLKNVSPVIKSKNVLFKHRCILLLFKLFPSVIKWVTRKIRK